MYVFESGWLTLAFYKMLLYRKKLIWNVYEEQSSDHCSSIADFSIVLLL